MLSRYFAVPVYDFAGEIHVRTSGAMSGSTTVATTTSNKPSAQTPSAILPVPRGGSAARLNGNSAVYVNTVTSSSCTLNVGSIPLSSSTDYYWGYIFGG
jgi:hypothetical protein